jgi:hypothetical protein
MKGIFLASFLILILFRTGAQERIISGYVKDMESGEVLIGAAVYCEATNTGCITNSFGFYSLRLPVRDSIRIVASYVGFARNTVLSDFIPDRYNFLLERDRYIEEATIISPSPKALSNTGISELSIEQIKQLPALFGEPDVLRALQSLPGISSGREGTTGLFVRGGTPDQNLFLLDDVPLYHVNHLGGFLSTFDPDAINSVKVYKGGFPARFEGRLSSIVDIRLKDGNMMEKKQAFTLGLLSAKYFIEAPLKPDTSSIMFSFRRCNIDLLTRAISLIDNDFDGMSGYTFYDLNLKYNRILRDGKRLYLSIYGGRDKLFVNLWDSGSEESDSDKYSYIHRERWGNIMGSVRLNQRYRSDLFCNTTFYITQFFYQNLGTLEHRVESGSNDATNHDQYLYLQSGAADITFKKELSYYMNARHKMDFGIAGTLHVFNPGKSDYSDEALPKLDITSRMLAPKLSAYISDFWHITNRIRTEWGLAGILFFTEDAHYKYLEPRISNTIQIVGSNSFVLSYARMHQIVHLLSNSSTGLPANVWIPSTKMIEPEGSDQLAMGFESQFGARTVWKMTAEVYYKWLGGLIELREGVSLFTDAGEWQKKIETGGKGTIKGVEFRLEKNTGITTGSVNYTLTKNERQFRGINSGNPYPYHYSKLHEITLVLRHNFSEKVSVSAQWNYHTGFPITLAKAKYPIDFMLIDGRSVIQDAHAYKGRNSSRMPDYHRLDLGVRFRKKVRLGTRTWSFSIYNAYNRQNAYYLFYDQKENSNETGLYQLSLFPIVPSFSYSLSF